MTPPAVRLVPGAGVALRTAGIIAWIAPVPDRPESPDADLAGIVRELVVATARTQGSIPTEALAAITGRHPWLTMAVVVLDDERGCVWTHGDADVLVERTNEQMFVDGQVGATVTRTFQLPCRAVRLGNPHGASTWSHLVEGAAPAGGVAVVWELPGSPDEPAARQFDAVPLLDVAPADRPSPLPVAVGDQNPADHEELLVSGLRCSRGHFNHPLAANCAWCGISMIQASHVLVRRPRPPLGVLVVDGRATFTLDGDYVVGRQPDHHPEVDGHHVRGIMLAVDPSISRAHAAIRLREWDVLAEDLHSGIGTWVQQPGQQPFRLAPGGPVALAPGAVVYLGSHRLIFHSHHLR